MFVSYFLVFFQYSLIFFLAFAPTFAWCESYGVNKPRFLRDFDKKEIFSFLFFQHVTFPLMVSWKKKACSLTSLPILLQEELGKEIFCGLLFVTYIFYQTAGRFVYCPRNTWYFYFQFTPWFLIWSNFLKRFGIWLWWCWVKWSGVYWRTWHITM